MSSPSSPGKSSPNEKHLKTRTADITKFFNPLRDSSEMDSKENIHTLPSFDNVKEEKSLGHVVSNTKKSVETTEKRKRGRPRRSPLELRSLQNEATANHITNEATIGEQTHSTQRRSVRLKNKPVSQYFIPLSFEEENAPLSQTKSVKQKKSNRKSPSLENKNATDMTSYTVEKLEQKESVPIQTEVKKSVVSGEREPIPSDNIPEEIKSIGDHIHPFFRKDKAKATQGDRELSISHELSAPVHPFFLKPQRQSNNTALASFQTSDRPKSDLSNSSQEVDKPSEHLHRGLDSLSITSKELLANFYSGREVHPFLQPRASFKPSNVSCKVELSKAPQYPALYPQAYPHQHGHVRQLQNESITKTESNLPRRKIPKYNGAEISRQANQFFQRYQHSNTMPYKSNAMPTNQTCHLTADQIRNHLESVYSDTLLNSSSCLSLFQQLLRSERTTSDGTLPWFEKHRPRTAAGILNNQLNVDYLLEWLNKLKVNPVVNKVEELELTVGKNGNRGRSRRVVSSEEDEFNPEKEYSSSEEFQTPSRLGKKKRLKHGSSGNFKITSKVILLDGEIGSCKTSAVYTCAETAGYEVFEINPGMKRSGRDMLNLVGEMSQSHLVASRGWNPKSDVSLPAESDARQSTTKQSLILIEEADILFEEDRNFWGSIVTLVEKSKRPIVITCNDLSRIPTWEVSLQSVLHFDKPDIKELTLYSNLVCLLEGYFVDPLEIYRICHLNNGDVRKTLQCLQFWCKSVKPLVSFNEEEQPTLESKKRDIENEEAAFKRQKIGISHFVPTSTEEPSDSTDLLVFQRCDLPLLQMFGIADICDILKSNEKDLDKFWSEMIDQCESISKFGKRQYWFTERVIEAEIDSLSEYNSLTDVPADAPLTEDPLAIDDAREASTNTEENCSHLRILESMCEYSENLSFGAAYLGLNETRDLQVLEPDVYAPSKNDNQGLPILYKTPSPWDHLTTDDEIRMYHEVLSRLRLSSKTKHETCNINLEHFSIDRILNYLVFETRAFEEYSTSRALDKIIPLDLALSPTVYTRLKNEGIPYLLGYMKVISRLEQNGPPRGRTRAKARSRYLYMLDTKEGDKLVEDYLNIGHSSRTPVSEDYQQFMNRAVLSMNQLH